MGLTTRLEAVFREKCEGVALERRLALRLRAFDPLPAEMLAAHLDAALVTLDQYAHAAPTQVALLAESEAWSAAVLSQFPLRILLNPRHAPVRRESDLMHELAHVLLRHDMARFDAQTGLPLRRERDEDEATFLGGCLQIPRSGLLWAVQKNLTVSQTAAHFGASEAMTRFRGSVTGVKLPHE